MSSLVTNNSDYFQMYYGMKFSFYPKMYFYTSLEGRVEILTHLRPVKDLDSIGELPPHLGEDTLDPSP